METQEIIDEIENLEFHAVPRAYDLIKELAIKVKALEYKLGPPSHGDHKTYRYVKLYDENPVIQVYDDGYCVEYWGREKNILDHDDVKDWIIEGKLELVEG